MGCHGVTLHEPAQLTAARSGRPSPPNVRGGLRRRTLDKVAAELGLASTVEAVFATLSDAPAVRGRLATAFAVDVDGISLGGLDRAVARRAPRPGRTGRHVLRDRSGRRASDPGIVVGGANMPTLPDAESALSARASRCCRTSSPT